MLQITGNLKQKCCIEKDVVDNLTMEGIEFISLGDVNVKGFANPVEVFKLTSLEFSC